MNEKEAEMIHNFCEQYWLDFSKLVNETLRKAPEHLRDDLAMRLQEKSSVYGRNTRNTS